MQIFQNPPWQYSKHQTRAKEIEKCLDEGLETTYYFSIFILANIGAQHALGSQVHF